MKISLLNLGLEQKINRHCGQNDCLLPNLSAQPQYIKQVRSTFSPAYFHPSFCGENSISQLSKFLDFVIENPNELTLKNKKAKRIDFQSVISSCIKPENHLGSGSFANIYRIDDKYCFKLYKGLMLRTGDVNVIKKPLFKDLKCWYGKGEVLIGNATILRNANPDGKAIAAGVQNTMVLTDELRAHYNKKYLPACAKLPQKAFDDLAAEFKMLNNVYNPEQPNGRSYSFDTINPNNFLITGNSFKIVDEIDSESGNNLNNLSSMLNVFLLKYNLHLSAYADDSLFIPRREILKKCILACEKAELPWPEEFISKIRYSFTMSGLQDKWPLAEKKINELRETIPNVETRVKEIEEYFDSL